MQLKIYSIRDAKSGIFNQPFFGHTHAEAERNFHVQANKDGSMVKEYPEDYDLYFLGEFDNETGKYAPLDTPQHMIKAIQVKQ